MTSDCGSAAEEYLRLMCNLKGHCHSDKSSSLVLNLSPINPIPACDVSAADGNDSKDDDFLGCDAI